MWSLHTSASMISACLKLESSFGFDAVVEPASIIPKEDFFFYLYLKFLGLSNLLLLILIWFSYNLCNYFFGK